jgi:hypothetical protein
MSLGERFHLILVHVLLVVLGVHAITPDSENLASLRSLRTLHDRSDPSSNGTESPENSPDDDSGPVRLAQNLGEDGRVLDTMDPRFLPSGPIDWKTRRDARPKELVGRHFSQMESILRMHCCLTC